VPELPEVETVVRGLSQAVVGSTISRVSLHRKDIRFPFPKGFAKLLAGKRIVSVLRRAKYILITLDSGDTVIAHLGMSGRFSVVKKAPKAYETHDHVVWHLADGRELIYNDARRFGFMLLAKAHELHLHPMLAKLGPEPLEKGFSTAYLRAQLAKRRGPIKPVLMNQELVVGVGNIYASEALHMAGIHPESESHKASAKAALLIKCIREVLSAAIRSGGSSLRDFVQLSGQSGYFQHCFHVYDRAGEPCTTCKTAIVAIRQAGRSTFFCPKCQN